MSQAKIPIADLIQDVMSTGQVVQRVPDLAEALLNDDPDLAKMLAMGMKRVIVPGQDGNSSFTVSQVSSITVETGRSAVIRLADGNEIEVGGDSNSLNSTGGLRHSLKSGQDSQAQGEVVVRCLQPMWQCQDYPHTACSRIYPDGRIERYCVRHG